MYSWPLSSAMPRAKSQPSRSTSSNGSATPRARAGLAAARRSGRSRGSSERSRRSWRPRISPTTRGRSPHGTTLGRPAGAADAVGDPGGRIGDVALVGRVGADGRDRDELGELGDERPRSVGVPRRSESPVGSSTDPGVPGFRASVAARLQPRSLLSPDRYATSRTLLASANARSFFRLWCSIWRIRSRVTLNVRPTSSSVRGCWPSSP